MLESLTPATLDETLDFLAGRPFDNVFVHWLIVSHQAGRNDVALWRDATGRIAGVCYSGAQIVPCGVADAIDAFAGQAWRGRSARMIVGPRDAVERFWRRARSAFPAAPSSIRTSQPVYALERSGANANSGDPSASRKEEALDVGLATLAELDELAPESAQMIAGEIGGDPARAGSEFRNRTARIIEHGWWWRARVAGQLAFMCNVGSASPQTAQLQGVWTPPAMRGRGYATRALAAISHRLFAAHPSLCLYVNDFNAPAVALYERVGFARVGEFQTILLP